MDRKFQNGARVTVGGDLSRWTRIAQANLPGATGVVEDYKPDYDYPHRPAYLVKFDRPVQVNETTEFSAAWLAPENLTG